MQRLDVGTIATRAMNELGLPAPASIVANTDDLAPQLRAILYKVAAHIIAAHNWQALKVSTSFTTTATEDQGNVFTLFSDFNRFVDGTLYNSTLGRKLRGPANSQQWQQAQSGIVTASAYPWWRVMRNKLLILNQTTAGETITLEYISNHWLEDADTNPASTIVSAADICVFDANLMIAGLQFMHLSANGFQSKSKEVEFLSLLKAAIADDVSVDTIDMVPGQSDFFDYPFDIVVTP